MRNGKTFQQNNNKKEGKILDFKKKSVWGNLEEE